MNSRAENIDKYWGFRSRRECWGFSQRPASLRNYLEIARGKYTAYFPHGSGSRKCGCPRASLLLPICAHSLLESVASWASTFFPTMCVGNIPRLLSTPQISLSWRARGAGAPQIWRGKKTPYIWSRGGAKSDEKRVLWVLAIVSLKT